MRYKWLPLAGALVLGTHNQKVVSSNPGAGNWKDIFHICCCKIVKCLIERTEIKQKKVHFLQVVPTFHSPGYLFHQRWFQQKMNNKTTFVIRFPREHFNRMPNSSNSFRNTCGAKQMLINLLIYSQVPQILHQCGRPKVYKMMWNISWLVKRIRLM